MACILFLVLYHLNDIFCRLAPIRLRAPPRGGPGTGDCFGIQCTLTVCWSSLADCSASVLLPLGGIGEEEEEEEGLFKANAVKEEEEDEL